MPLFFHFGTLVNKERTTLTIYNHIFSSESHGHATLLTNYYHIALLKTITSFSNNFL